MHTFFSIFAFFSAAVLPLYASDQVRQPPLAAAVSNPKKFEMLLSLVDPDEKNGKSGVLIMIPTTFKTTDGLKASTYTFVPRLDTDLQRWSEIITVNIHVGAKMRASTLNQSIKDKIIQHALDVSIKQVEIRSHGSCDVAKLIMTYTHAHQREIVACYAYSDFNNCSYIQHKLALLNNKTEEEALAYIHAFRKENLVRITF